MIYDRKELKYNVSELKYVIDNKLKIDIEKLRSSENVDQFIFNLSGTEFFDFMRESYDEIPLSRSKHAEIKEKLSEFGIKFV